MKTIWKHPLTAAFEEPTKILTLHLPTPLMFAFQNDRPYLWIEGLTNAEAAHIEAVIYTTGGVIADGFEYVDTTERGGLVLHLYWRLDTNPGPAYN